MKTRTATLIVAALALTFTAACGDGSFGLTGGSQTANLELKGGNGGGKGGGGKTDGGGGYNCKPDKQVDVAATLDAVTPTGGMQVHIATTNGSDASGEARTAYFHFEDAAGTVHTISPRLRQSCPLSIVDDPTDFKVEPLEPGATYTVTAVTRDLCGNTAESAPLQVVMPEIADDVTPPTISEIAQTRVTIFIANVPGLVVFANDGESAIDRVEFFVNGEFHQDDSESGLHGWSDPEGETYLAYFANEHLGQTVEVTAVAYDVFGNATSTTRTITVPTT